ncbi:MAG: hypothetical protein PWP27_1669, partial [Clostridiales bacterium]|nr:hypothetical protein [Clostridiales bacterium]
YYTFRILFHIYYCYIYVIKWNFGFEIINRRKTVRSTKKGHFQRHEHTENSFGEIYLPVFIPADTVLYDLTSSFMILIASCMYDIFLADLIAYISIFVMAFIGGGIIPLTYLPGSIESVSLFSINKWAIQGLIYSVFWNRIDMVIGAATILGILSFVFIFSSFLALARTVR